MLEGPPILERCKGKTREGLLTKRVGTTGGRPNLDLLYEGHPQSRLARSSGTT